MHFERFYDEDLAQAAYAIACSNSGKALIIDPLRDFDCYIDWAEAEGYEITHVAETHIHADFLSGARQLARATDAELLVSGAVDGKWAYQGLDEQKHRKLTDGDMLKIGSVRLRILHTPGHTPEHITFSVLDDDDTDRIVLTGDFVFVDDLGRPDLVDNAEELAHRMYRSLRKFRDAVHPHAVVWPGHGSGSACGKSIGEVPMSSVGRETHRTWWAPLVENAKEEEFVKQLLEGQSKPPRYFSRMKELNRDGTAGNSPLEHPARMTPHDFEALAKDDSLIVDTRSLEDFAHGHIPGSWRLSLAHLSTHGGAVLPPDPRILLVCSENEVEPATRSLLRIGQTVVGWVPSLPQRMNTNEFRILDAEQAHEAVTGDAQILDVRTEAEYEEGHIPGATNIPYGELPDRFGELDRDTQWVIHCARGTRAILAASILESEGFENLWVFPPGPQGWKEAGYQLER